MTEVPVVLELASDLLDRHCPIFRWERAAERRGAQQFCRVIMLRHQLRQCGVAAASTCIQRVTSIAWSWELA